MSGLSVDLVPSDPDAWRKLRRSLERRRTVQMLGRCFRRNPVAYLRSLEETLIKTGIAALEKGEFCCVPLTRQEHAEQHQYDEFDKGWFEEQVKKYLRPRIANRAGGRPGVFSTEEV